MDDGWDDDIDLELTQDEDDILGGADDDMPSTTAATHFNPPAPSPFAPIVPSPAPPVLAANDDNGIEVEDGWGDDNDNFFDDDDDLDIQDSNNNDASQPLQDDDDGGFPAAPQPPSQTVAVTTTQPAGGDGWDDDDDDLNFDDDGWGDDTDDILEDTNDTRKQNQAAAPVVPIKPVPEHPGPLQSQQQPPLQSNQRIMEELQNYVSSLDRMLSSINAVLEYEYNTVEKAYELVEYYSSRPQLAEYTITKELQRMNYQVILPHGHIETDKEQIVANNLLPEQSLVSRAANQSLLADLLHVITGHDMIVRPQYLAICIASWCQFTIHLGDEGQDLVQCQAKLHLSLPTEQGDRLDVANVHVSVVFSPGQPMIEYKVHKIEMLLQDFSQLSGTAEFLFAMEGHLDEVPGHLETEQMQNAPSDIFRDQFLENSQRLLSQSKIGMKSALQQVDSVINIGGKIKAISNFIPATDTMLAAEQEAMALAEARRQEMERRQQDEPLHHHHHPAPMHPNEPQSHLFPRPPQPAPPQQPTPAQDLQDPANRPKSILGSLFGKLANTVDIPAENDPAIYGAAAPQPPAPEAEAPVFYRKEAPTPKKTPAVPQAEPPLKLYRKEEPAPPVPFPKLYQRDEPSKPAPPNPPASPPKPLQSPQRVSEVQSTLPMATANTVGHAFVPTSPRAEMRREEKEEAAIVDDGWGEEDAILDELNDAFEDDADEVPPNNSKKPEAKDGWDNVERSGAAGSGGDTGPTRKRWRNPRPNRPYLYGLV